MSWPDFLLARQLLAEERVGARVREASHEEDGDFAAAASILSRTGG